MPTTEAFYLILTFEENHVSKLIRSDYATDPEYVEFLKKNNYQRVISLLDGLPEAGSIFIVHDNDPDGCCSNALLRMYLRHYSPVSMVASLPVGHGLSFQTLDLAPYIKDNTTTLVILDHSVNEAMQKELSKKVANIVIFDHHPETVEAKDLPSIVVSSCRWSTTALVDGLLTVRKEQALANGETKIPPSHYRLAKAVNHYDCYLFDGDIEYDSRVKALLAEIFSVSAVNTDWDGMLGDDKTQWDMIDRYIRRGNELIAHQLQLCKKIVSGNMLRLSYEDRTRGTLSFGLIFHSDIMDTIANYALRNNPELDFVAIAYLKAGNTGRVFKLSLRSVDDRADVSQIALHIGSGGGHKQAAGVEMSFVDFLDFISNVYPSTSKFGALL